MKTLNLIQGTREWHAHRATHFNASDAPAMMGCSPYKTRSALLHELATGQTPPVSDELQARFDEGHRTEALARTKIAEPMIGEDLYPVVGEDGQLSASFDGITLDEEVNFEHKSLNKDLREALPVSPGEGVALDAPAALPLVYRVQMEHQLAVSGGKRTLFIASKWDGDTLVEWRGCWYTPDLELRAQILRGWEQFAADLAAYKPPEVASEVVAAAIPALPALSITVEGRVLQSNLPAFRDAAAKFLEGISTDLKTDQDFANAANTIKFCEDGEKRLEVVKAQAQSQAVSIDVLFRTIDEIKDLMRDKRLTLDKLVKARKESIRVEIAQEHQSALREHIAKLNMRLGHDWLTTPAPTLFGEAMKGKKTVASVRESCSVALANAKIAASELADRLEVNRRNLVRDKDWFFLFADFAQAGNAAPEVFGAVADQRIRKHLDAEAEAEAKRLAAETVARAAAAPPPAPIAAAPVMQAAAAGVAMLETARIAQSAGVAVLDDAPPINLSAITKRLGFVLTREFIEGTLKVPHLRRDGASYFWAPTAFGQIKKALIAHVEAAQ